MKQLNLDELEDTQEDLRDLMEDQEEIQNVLGQDFGVGEYDENELQQELEELDEDIVNEKMEGQEAPAYLPQKVPAVVKKDKEELEQIMNK